MTNEELRQKAIECAKAITQRCCNPCKECEYGEYFPMNIDVSCLAVNGYEHGFADGIEEGKRLSTAWIPVTERLPEDADWKLVYWRESDSDFRGVPQIACYCKGNWHFITKQCPEYIALLEVIAWMPLPEPYKKGEEA